MQSVVNTCAILVGGVSMSLQLIITELDNEIARLTQVRALLIGSSDGNYRTPKHHIVSAAGRKRIADAQRKRWAKVKRAAK